MGEFPRKTAQVTHSAPGTTSWANMLKRSYTEVVDDVCTEDTEESPTINAMTTSSIQLCPDRGEATEQQQQSRITDPTPYATDTGATTLVTTNDIDNTAMEKSDPDETPKDVENATNNMTNSGNPQHINVRLDVYMGTRSIKS